MRLSIYVVMQLIKNPQTFKTHHLETLLGLSGIENKVKLVYHAEWTMVT
jgi:hypothetical protein